MSNYTSSSFVSCCDAGCDFHLKRCPVRFSPEVMISMCYFYLFMHTGVIHNLNSGCCLCRLTGTRRVSHESLIIYFMQNAVFSQVAANKKILNQGFPVDKLRSSLRKCYGRHHDLVNCNGISESQMITDMIRLL